MTSSDRVAEIRAKVNSALHRRQYHLETLTDCRKRLTVASELANDWGNVLAISRKAAGLVQDSLATKVSGIVTKALRTVFESDIEFVAEFVERRNVSECDLYVRENGEVYDILKGRGGGLADVCSLCLQIAFIIMSGKRRILFADEIARHIDSAAQDRFAAVLSDLCRELQFTIVTVTHAQPLVEVADRVFTVTQKKGVSYVGTN